MKQIYKSLVTFLLLSIPIQSQEVAREDYKRAVSFMHDNYNNKTAFNLNTEANWFKDGSGLRLIDKSMEGKSYKTVDFKNYKDGELNNQEKLAKA
jgi:hypothetical protein